MTPLTELLTKALALPDLQIAGLTPIHQALVKLVGAVEKTPDAEHGELKDALAELREACEGKPSSGEGNL